VLDRADVDTDQIIPKQFLKRIERTGFGEFLFYDWAQEPGWSLPKNPILATGPNFGCGSSREHAPWALQDYGFQAIISPRFADIFRNNCLKIGLVPVTLPQDVVTRIMAAVTDDATLEIVVDVVDRRVAVPALDLDEPFELDDHTHHRLLNGLDDIGLTEQKGAEIDAFEARRPAFKPSAAAS
jgi:3-isopropylmalate/(R)-2-methylmalate dehydratase small subunit